MSIRAMKVSSKSNAKQLAGAIAGETRAGNDVELLVIGAGALNQAVKAVIIAEGFLAGAKVSLMCSPSFSDVMLGGQQRTALRLLIQRRPTTFEEFERAVATAADNALGLFFEYRDQHGCSEDDARVKALLEVYEGTRAIEEIAGYKKEAAAHG